LDEDALARNTSSYRADIRWIGIGGIFLVIAASTAAAGGVVVGALIAILAVASVSVAAVDLRRARQQKSS